MMRWDTSVHRWRGRNGRFLPRRPPMEITLIDEPDAQFEASLTEAAATIVEHYPVSADDLFKAVKADHVHLRRGLLRALFRPEAF